MNCDIFISGGGISGLSAALIATKLGKKVILCEETDWLGGQITSQGLPSLDELPHINTFGGTRLYYEFRDNIRNYYKSHYKLSETGKSQTYFNPGGSIDNKFSFEPKVAIEVINNMIKEAIDKNLLEILYNTKVQEVLTIEENISKVSLVNLLDNTVSKVYPKFVIDCTELGELIDIAKIPYSTGIDSFKETHELSAHTVCIPEATQCFTYTFAIEYIPNSINKPIKKPELYDEFSSKIKFSINPLVMYDPDKKNTFISYRRIIDPRNFDDPNFNNIVTLINWRSNDYSECSLLHVTEEEKKEHLYRAQQLSLSFLYWLQTQAPRHDGSQGYPEIKFRNDIMGTDSGLSKYPYIRESRRLNSMYILKENDVCINPSMSIRGNLFSDSICIGKYLYIDIHKCYNSKILKGSGNELAYFQIPLGCLICDSVKNFSVAGKNIGVTHITNGACRYHFIEWSLGEASSILQCFCIDNNCTVIDVYNNLYLLRKYRIELLKNGIPLYWYTDVYLDNPHFISIQFLALEGVIEPNPNNLEFNPNDKMNIVTANIWLYNARRKFGVLKKTRDFLLDKVPISTKAEFASLLYGKIINLLK